MNNKIFSTDDSRYKETENSSSLDLQATEIERCVAVLGPYILEHDLI